MAKTKPPKKRVKIEVSMTDANCEMVATIPELAFVLRTRGTKWKLSRRPTLRHGHYRERLEASFINLHHPGP